MFAYLEMYGVVRYRSMISMSKMNDVIVRQQLMLYDIYNKCSYI